MKHLLKPLIASLALVYARQACAGAWLQEEGSGQVITTMADYTTNGTFSIDGQRLPQTGSYHKYEVDIYAEYGLSSAYTLGLQPSWLWVHSGAERESGLGDTAFFLRERLWHDAANVVSLQELATLPGPYNKNSAAALGYGQSDLELRGLYGHNGSVCNVPYFADVETAYRERFDGPADELRLDAALGIRPVNGLTLLAQSFNVKGLHDASTQMFVTQSGPDYDLSTLQLSGVVDIAHGFSLQLGGSADVAGRNTSSGRTLFAAIWKSF